MRFISVWLLALIITGFWRGSSHKSHTIASVLALRHMKVRCGCLCWARLTGDGYWAMIFWLQASPEGPPLVQHTEI